MVTPDAPRSVFDIDRNDIDGCRRFWQSRDITAQEWRIMLRLQDDPAALVEAAKTWAPAEP